MSNVTKILTGLFLFTIYSCGSFQTKAGGKAGNEANADPNDEFFREETGPKLKAGEKPGNDRDAKTDTSKGYASWYGKELQGKPTASGEMFDMEKYTAAHRSFPLGSLVLVRNLENGKKKLVRINDRGPYVDGRIIDVSFAVARELDFAEKGVARVEVELIEESADNFLGNKTDNKTKAAEEISGKDSEISNENSKETDPVDLPSESPAGEAQAGNVEKLDDSGDYTFTDGLRPNNFTVRTGAFKNVKNAERYKEELEDKYNINAYLGKKGKWHFVWIGDFENKTAAKKFYKKLKTDGLDVLNPGKVQ